MPVRPWTEENGGGGKAVMPIVGEWDRKGDRGQKVRGGLAGEDKE